MELALLVISFLAITTLLVSSMYKISTNSNDTDLYTKMLIGTSIFTDQKKCKH